MENSAIGIGRLDCYEDMFKEITRKLYGDDPDHRTSSVQNEFETSVSYKNEDDTGHGTDSDDGQWVCEDEPLKGTDGSRIASYHAGKSTWRCYECGECMGGSPRDIGEHFVEHHSSRIISDDSRHRNNPTRKDYLHASDPKLEDIVGYLERVRDRAERAAPPLRRTQETQTVPAALLPATTTFLLQELSSTTPHLHSSPTMMSSSSTTLSSSKRYTCPCCPYGTDRRDLYTRHENIHREEKPFHCYVCYKPFNRADHVKKHFLRMHREHTYELSRIRRSPGSVSNGDIKPHQQQDTNGTNINGNNGNNHHTNYTTNYNNNKNYQLQTSQASSVPVTPTLYQNSTTTMSGVIGNIQDNFGNRRINNTGCNSKSHLKAGSKSALEKRYTCSYCSWSGVDNWCLKRHLNTHLKPFACSMCEYKAARAERLSTHVLKVHNKRQCSRCSFLGEDISQLQLHQLHAHRINSGVNGGGVSAPTSSAPQVSLHSPTTATTPPTSASSCNRPDQPLHPVGGGRPPPGPPVFPTASPAVISQPTTILGNALTNGRNRSRKQSEPRKVLTNQCESDEEDNGNDNYDNKTKLMETNVSNKIKCENRLRCYLCPKSSSARALKTRPYHTKVSLTLHTMWRHCQKMKNKGHQQNSVRLKI